MDAGHTVLISRNGQIEQSRQYCQRVPSRAGDPPTLVRHFIGRDAVRLSVQAVLIYLACRALSAVVIAFTARHQQPLPSTGPSVNYFELAAFWDGQWYQSIASSGYPQELPRGDDGEVLTNEWAFLPIYPFLARLVMAVTALPFSVVGPCIATVAGCAAAVFIAVLIRDRLGGRVALAGVAVLAAAPQAPALQIAYADSLGLLAVSAFVFALSRERWLVAASLALVAGLTRPVSAPMIVVIVAAVWLRYRRRGTERLSTAEVVRMAAAVGLVAVSSAVWPVIAWSVTGERSAYVQSQAAWWHEGDFRPFQLWSNLLQVSPVAALFITGFFAVLLAVFAGPWAAGLGAVMRSWAIAYLAYIAVVAGSLMPTFRHLLLAFPLGVVLLGASWKGQTAKDLLPRTSILVLVGLAGQVWWTWTFLQYSPPLDTPP